MFIIFLPRNWKMEHGMFSACLWYKPIFIGSAVDSGDGFGGSWVEMIDWLDCGILCGMLGSIASSPPPATGFAPVLDYFSDTIVTMAVHFQMISANASAENLNHKLFLHTATPGLQMKGEWMSLCGNIRYKLVHWATVCDQRIYTCNLILPRCRL